MSFMQKNSEKYYLFVKSFRWKYGTQNYNQANQLQSQ